jgi:bacteriocin-like protein
MMTNVTEIELTDEQLAHINGGGDPHFYQEHDHYDHQNRWHHQEQWHPGYYEWLHGQRVWIPGNWC